MQNELTRSEARDDKRLILGFDAGCFTCSDLAARIEERVGDKLAVRNLNDPEVQGWREQALGEGAKWAPTLFEIEDGKAKAWTGWRMGWALSRSIGPAATWKVMQVLGEAGAVPRIEGSTIVDKLPARTANTLVGMSRGRFLKGVGGAAVALSVLSTTDLLASSATAAKRKTSPYDIIGSSRISRMETMRAARQVGSSVDIKNLVGYALSTPGKVAAAKPQGFLHKLRNGSKQRVIVFRISDDRSVAHVQFNNPPKTKAPTRAYTLQRDKKRLVIVKASEGGKLWRVDPNFPGNRSDGSTVKALGECPPISNNPPGKDYCWVKRQVCVDWDWSLACGFSGGFAAISCGECIAAVLATYNGVLPAAWAIGKTCGSCAGGVGGTLGSCCAQWCWVQQWDVRPGCGLGPS